MWPTCEYCNERLPITARSDARFCSTRCRVAAHRAKRLPAEMTTRTQWTRRDGKRPIGCRGCPASSTNRATWTTYKHVMSSDAGDGIGIMLGGGLGCYDLDHCLPDGIPNETAERVLSEVDPIYVERSMSGNGLHVFVRADEASGYRRGGVEFYSRARFIAVTGDRFR